jgi:hypothetical protein
VTAVELMPIHQFIYDKTLVDKGLSNYWGYNSIGFFAPHSAYSSSGKLGEQVKEFKAMVKTLHKAGIEVILDVVYNHTAEGNHYGPDALLPRHRQPGLLPPLRQQRPHAAVLQRLHRHGQYAQHAAPAVAATGDGQPPLLGHRNARGRLPLSTWLRPWPAACTRWANSPRSSIPSTRTRSSRR